MTLQRNTLSECVVCQALVCIIEDCNVLPHREGVELHNGTWVCSSACWEKYTEDKTNGKD